MLAGWRRRDRLRGFRDLFDRRSCYSFAQESGRDGSRQHRAIVVLLHLQSVEERLHVGIVARHRDRTLSGVKELEKRAQLLGQAVSIVAAAGESFGPEVYSPQIPRRGHHRGRLGKQERQGTTAGQAVHGIDFEDRPSQAGEGTYL